MLDRNAARDLAVEHLANESFIILDQETIEKAWGWMFFYQSRRYVETGELTEMLAGNAPLIVERETGRILPCGTVRPIDHYIENYENTGDPHGTPRST